MKVLVTGCAGFIGSHITEALLARGHEVVGVDDFSTGNGSNLLHFSKHGDRFTFHNFDLLHIDGSLGKGITHICHQAAHGSVPRSIEQPHETFKNNVMGFQNVLSFARISGVKRVVFASSSSVYGQGNGQATSPYGMTKQVNEMQAAQYHKHYGLETIGLRYHNVYGPRQRTVAVIPTWIEALQSGKPIEITGDGKQTRDFTYVKDVVEANLLALDCEDADAFGECFDIGVGSSTTLNYLSAELILTMNKWPNTPKQIHIPDRQGDISSSRANKTKAFDLIGFNARYPLREGLRDWLSPTK